MRSQDQKRNCPKENRTIADGFRYSPIQAFIQQPVQFIHNRCGKEDSCHNEKTVLPQIINNLRIYGYTNIIVSNHRQTIPDSVPDTWGIKDDPAKIYANQCDNLPKYAEDPVVSFLRLHDIFFQ